MDAAANAARATAPPLDPHLHKRPVITAPAPPPSYGSEFAPQMRRHQEPRPVEVHDGGEQPGEDEQGRPGRPRQPRSILGPRAVPRPKCRPASAASTHMIAKNALAMPRARLPRSYPARDSASSSGPRSQ